MLERFRNPRWQHPDSEVRRRAVEELADGEDTEAITQVARGDALPAIRRLALRRILDLALLEERAREDPDATVREHAARRHREVLAGLVEGGPSLAERMEHAAREHDPALIEYLAREGKEDGLRKQAMARVERETVLRDVALKDPNHELRLEALARIQDEAVLTRVCEQSRKSDKRVSRTARERLDAIQAERERPQQVATESQRICDTLEGFGRDGHWQRGPDLLDRLEARWEALDPTLRQAFEQRFTEARERFVAELAAFRESASVTRAAKEALIGRLEALGDAAQERDRDDIKAWVRARESALREARAAWNETARLPEGEEQELETRFGSAETAVREAVTTERRRKELSRLLAEHDRLLARKGAIAESDVKTLGRALEESSQQASAGGALAALTRRVDKAHGKLRDRLREQAAWKETTLAALPARLDALKTALAEGRAGDATAGHDAIGADLDALLTAGTSTERLAKARSRLKSMTHEVKVMRAWGKFGAQQARERLCEQMEALKGAEQPPPAIAQQVREARAAWKELATTGEGVDQALWHRFDAAATEAYRPCKAYFAEQAGTRKTNLERRRALIEELERFVESATGGPDMDWKGAVRFRRELLRGWRDAHPVERKPGKPLAERFDARLAELDNVLGREHERSVRYREQLITEAEALAGNEDKKAAAETCKRLQRQWSVSVPGSRGQENALWERFRGACDAVFAGRQQMFDQERASFKAGLEQRQVLCERLEALLGVGAKDLAEAERELHRTQGEWSRSAPAPRREAEAVEKRFTAAVRRFEKHKRALEAQRKRDALELMRSKAALCHEAECLPDEATGVASPDAVAALEGRWQALTALPDADDEAAMAGRFQQALAAASGNAPRSAADALAANLERRRSVCLRLEILAGVDSPAEHAQERMALQVQRLASALKDRSQASGESPVDLLRAWCTGGPVPTELAAGLEARFERAWMAHANSADATGR